MKQATKRLALLLALLIGLTITPTAAEATGQGTRTDWGRKSEFGEGYVRSYFTSSREQGERRKPVEIGVYFTSGLLDSWPTSHSDGKYDILDADGNVAFACCGHELKVRMPRTARRLTAFDHIVLNMNPHGHPPPMVYNVPHIDFHFYTVSNRERLSMEGAPNAASMCFEGQFPSPFTCEDGAVVAAPVADDQMPPDYTNVGAVEPAMGNHLTDFTSPEFNGEPFTHTFIFGSNAGALNFWEPMMAKDYLESVKETGENICVDIKIPAAAPEANWYPTQYCITYIPERDAFKVGMVDWEWIPQSNGVVTPPPGP